MPSSPPADNGFISNPRKIAVLRLLDILFHAAHLFVILFSVFGWVAPLTRPYHLALQGLIFLSWFGLGTVRGWTYCFLTDLHWRVKRALHQTDPGESYVKLLADRTVGRDVDLRFVKTITVAVYGTTTVLSLLLFLGDSL